MKTRILLTISLALAMHFIVSAQPNELISNANEQSLDATKLEKLNAIKNKPYHKNAQLVRMGSISSLQNRGAIPFTIPGKNGRVVAN